MKRILLDTNIYGLAVEKNEEEIFKEILTKSDLIVYGCSVIRKELRDTPKEREMEIKKGVARNFRVLLLSLYDVITKNHEIIIDEKTQTLADKYLRRFSELTGKTAIDHLKNDFLLVACATLNDLDLIVSEDHKTLLSIEAIRTYNLVNSAEELKLPGVFTYAELKILLKRWSLL